jgi:hypothetical protein
LLVFSTCCPRCHALVGLCAAFHRG